MKHILLSQAAIVRGAAFLVFIFSTSSVFADSFDRRWGPWLEMGGQFGDGRSIGEANLFAPIWQNPASLLFVDLRGSFDNRSAVEGNFGLGYRHMLDNGWNLGAYGYLDIRRTSLDSTFHQATFGVEALSDYVDLRANAYLPLGNREKRMVAGTSFSSTTTGPEAVLTGTSLAIQTQTVTTLGTNYLIERAMAGFDAEVGVRLPIFPDEMKLDFRAFAGGYHFEASGVESISGPRARLELAARDFAGLPGVKLTGGLTWQHDKPRGDQLIASIGLRIPFNVPAAREKPLSYMEERMLDRVVRDVDIVTNRRAESVTDNTILTTQTEDAINTWNGQRVASVTHVDAADGGADAQSHLNAIQVAAGSDGSVVVLNGDMNYVPGLTLNDRQTLIGGGTLLRVKGATSGVEIDYLAAGTSGSLVGSGRRATSATFTGLINLGSSSVVGGLTLTQNRILSENAVINAFRADDAKVFNNMIKGADRDYSHGIVFQESEGGIAFRNTITTGAAQLASTYGVVSLAQASKKASAIIEENIIFLNHNVSGGMGVEGGNAFALVHNNTIHPASTGWVVVAIDGGTYMPGSEGNVIVGTPAKACESFGSGAHGTVEFINAPACVFGP